MSSSGLIYAVIVGAWAAYLVPMWLRRQDELNESRPTERFSTAIRLLSGRAGAERRQAREPEDDPAAEPDVPEGDDRAGPERSSEAVTDSVDVRSFAVSASSDGHTRTEEVPGRRAPSPARQAASAAERSARSKALARRRRTTTVLFLAVTLGAIVAAVGGLRFLWAPAVPSVLLSGYVVHLRAQERRRWAYAADQRRAEAAAQRLRERQQAREARAEADPAASGRADEPAEVPARAASPHAAGRRALVEQTDHAEWVDQQRGRRAGEGESWEPVPVPLPTYVTAPVAPRATGGVDLDAPDAWSSARSSHAEPSGDTAAEQAGTAPGAASGRRPERGRTPLFDQYADDVRPRAANE